MKSVLIVGNSDYSIYLFKLELIQQLLRVGYRVVLVTPYGPRIPDFQRIGVDYVQVEVNRHGTKILEDAALLIQYRKIIKAEHPEMVFSFTIKPNIYCALACRSLRNVPIICTVTGLGTAVETKGLNHLALVALYRIAFRRVTSVFFQNKVNREFFIRNKIVSSNSQLVSGSGVNFQKFQFQPYPQQDSVRFLFSARIMYEKGIEYYLNAAEALKEKYPDTEYYVCGLIEDGYQGRLHQLTEKGIVFYCGFVEDTRPLLSMSHCVVLPSYYNEGLSNTLLEAAATGRPIITTDHLGCRETVVNDVSGMLVPIRNQQALIEAMEKMIVMPCEERRAMGLAGRKFVEQEMDRDVVVSKYLEELKHAAATQ